MQLTGREIIQEGIVKGNCESGVQQQGVDVRLIGVSKMDSSLVGTIPAEGKTTIPHCQPLRAVDGGWLLTPGYYEVMFEESISVPNNRALQFKTRSSLVRCGAIIESGQFDAGFHTPHAGAFLIVHNTIRIEHGARVAQAIVWQTNDVINTYNGQWQSDNQRK